MNFFLSAKDEDEDIGKSLSGKKYSQKLLHHAKQSATGAFKSASKRMIQKRGKTTGDLIGNKISDVLT